MEKWATLKLSPDFSLVVAFEKAALLITQIVATHKPTGSSGFGRTLWVDHDPRVLVSSNPGLKLAERLRRLIQWTPKLTNASGIDSMDAQISNPPALIQWTPELANASGV